MNNTFVNAMDNAANFTTTLNGAPCLKSTRNALVDAFGLLGAMRGSSDEEILDVFKKAYAVDDMLALKLLFYVRDCREGLGERRIFRLIAPYLADNHTDDIRRNLEVIPYYGRWDDLFCFCGTTLETEVLDILKDQFNSDLATLFTSPVCSLLGKWLPSCNASSKESRKLGLKISKYFGLSEKEYRKSLSALRKKIDIVERKMSANQWDEIDYAAVPSRAHNIYRNAFAEHDRLGYVEYLKRVETGVEKINSGVLYPYDLAGKYIGIRCIDKNPTIEAQWNALPNFVTNANDFLCMVDVSGSMNGRPMETSVGLGIYFAQRTTSAFHNRMITFSSQPSWVEIEDGMSLFDAVNTVYNAPWGGSTNLEAAFELILDTAVKNHIKPEDMPKNLVVITDMEIDNGLNNVTYDAALGYFVTKSDNAMTFMYDMEQRFKDAEYECPCVVWWNVNAMKPTFHANYADRNVRFISGQSATVFKQLCENMGESALDMVYNTLMGDRYSLVI